MDNAEDAGQRIGHRGRVKERDCERSNSQPRGMNLAWHRDLAVAGLFVSDEGQGGRDVAWKKVAYRQTHDEVSQHQVEFVR